MNAPRNRRQLHVRTLLFILGAISLSPMMTMAQDSVDSRLGPLLSNRMPELQTERVPAAYGLAEGDASIEVSGDSRRNDLIGAVVGAGIGIALTLGACASVQSCSEGVVFVGAVIGGLVGAGIGSRVGDGDSDENDPAERHAATVDPRLAVPVFDRLVESRIDQRSYTYELRAEDCDSDFDGALIGAAIGAAPPVVITLVSETDDLGGAAATAIAIGAVGGFLIGLAVDSSHCA